MSETITSFYNEPYKATVKDNEMVISSGDVTVTIKDNGPTVYSQNFGRTIRGHIVEVTFEKPGMEKLFGHAESYEIGVETFHDDNDYRKTESYPCRAKLTACFRNAMDKRIVLSLNYDAFLPLLAISVYKLLRKNERDSIWERMEEACNGDGVPIARWYCGADKKELESSGVDATKLLPPMPDIDRAYENIVAMAKKDRADFISYCARDDHIRELLFREGDGHWKPIEYFDEAHGRWRYGYEISNPEGARRIIKSDNYNSAVERVRMSGAKPGMDYRELPSYDEKYWKGIGMILGPEDKLRGVAYVNEDTFKYAVSRINEDKKEIVRRVTREVFANGMEIPVVRYYAYGDIDFTSESVKLVRTMAGYANL